MAKVSAKVTWLGEEGGAEENEWNGQVFKRGEAVTVTDEAMIAKAKANPYYKVAGDDSPTVEDNPPAQPLQGRVDDLPENIAFAPQEVLTARREQSIAAQEEEVRRGPGRPRKSLGGSETANERKPPKKRRGLAKSAKPGTTGNDYGSAKETF